MRLRPPVTTRPATPVPYPTVCRSEEERAGRGHLPDAEEHRRAQPEPPPLLWFVHGRTLPIRPSLGRLGSDLEGPRRHLGGVRVGDEALTTDICEQLGALRRKADRVSAAARAVDRRAGLRRRGEPDRQGVVSGKSVSVSVDLGGRRLINKKNKATS